MSTSTPTKLGKFNFSQKLQLHRIGNGYLTLKWIKSKLQIIKVTNTRMTSLKDSALNVVSQLYEEENTLENVNFLPISLDSFVLIYYFTPQKQN